MNTIEIVSCLRDLIENEARSCSMDFGCITPIYVYRMWGGSTSLEEIKEAMSALRQAKEPERRMV